jgi:hypothetical protein
MDLGETCSQEWLRWRGPAASQPADQLTDRQLVQLTSCDREWEPVADSHS